MATTTEPTGRPAPVPRPIPSEPGIPLPPDSISYRLKRRVLGAPLHSDELEHQRLGKPTALAVFASDNLSSSAYATEEILHVLLPVAGLVAFSLVFPITVAMCVVLGFLILSYRETIKEYPSAGGAYLVTKDNFGSTVAQVAGASLLVDYILTVAVSASAGTAALTSAFDVFEPYRVPIALFFISLIALGNLRGVKESGKIFAVPTYFFMANMGILLGLGLVKYLSGDLPEYTARVEGQIHWGAATGVGLLLGVKLFDVLHAFASGGAAVTGVEAISNGVPAFKEPAWKNARQTLVHHGHGARRDVPRPVGAGRGDQGVALRERVADGDRPDRRGRVRARGHGRPALLLVAGRHDADPGHGGQHRVRRLPPPGQLPGRRQLPARASSPSGGTGSSTRTGSSPWPPRPASSWS